MPWPRHPLCIAVGHHRNELQWPTPFIAVQNGISTSLFHNPSSSLYVFGFLYVLCSKTFLLIQVLMISRACCSFFSGMTSTTTFHAALVLALGEFVYRLPSGNPFSILFSMSSISASLIPPMTSGGVQGSTACTLSP